VLVRFTHMLNHAISLVLTLISPSPTPMRIQRFSNASHHEWIERRCVLVGERAAATERELVELARARGANLVRIVHTRVPGIRGTFHACPSVARSPLAP
jgi:hypothetical protein